MYLSRVAIDSHNRKKVRDLTHLGAFHNWIESSFPEEMTANIRSRKLWRIDKLKGKDYLLIVSDKKPDLDSLEKYGVPGSAETKSYDKFLNAVEEGQLYRFRVTLNPVKSLSQGPGRRGRVVPEITAGQKAIQLSKVTYEGLLSVADKEVFYHTLTEGIGKKKAYGFGLMTVIPI